MPRLTKKLQTEICNSINMVVAKGWDICMPKELGSYPILGAVMTKGVAVSMTQRGPGQFGHGLIPCNTRKAANKAVEIELLCEPTLTILVNPEKKKTDSPKA